MAIFWLISIKNNKSYISDRIINEFLKKSVTYEIIRNIFLISFNILMYLWFSQVVIARLSIEIEFFLNRER